MDVIIELANKIFKPVLEMGGPIIMLIILTVLALLFGVKFSKALEGGIKLANRSYWYRSYHRYAKWCFLSITCQNSLKILVSN